MDANWRPSVDVAVDDNVCFATLTDLNELIKSLEDTFPMTVKQCLDVKQTQLGSSEYFKAQDGDNNTKIEKFVSDLENLLAPDSGGSFQADSAESDDAQNSDSSSKSDNEVTPNKSSTHDDIRPSNSKLKQAQAQYRPQLHALHRIRRGLKKINDNEAGLGAYIPRPRTTVINRPELFYRFGEKEKEAIDAFSFLYELSTSDEDDGEEVLEEYQC